jgi:hypothetical protein
MSTVQEIQAGVPKLSPAELAKLTSFPRWPTPARPFSFSPLFSGRLEALPYFRCAFAALCCNARMRLVATLGLFICLALELPVAGASAKHQAQVDALFATNQVVPIRIEISPEGIRSLRREPRKYVPATIREGDIVYTNLLIHLRGSIGSFRPVNGKAGFTVKVEKGAPRFHGLKKFHFNNSVQDHTYLSEWVCTELFRQAGVPAPRVTHAFVELNGRKLGLYQLKESFNEDFLARYFKNTEGNLYGQPGNADVSDPLERVQGPGENTHADLRLLARAAHEPNAAKSWEQLQRVLDVNRFLSFMAMEVMLCHWDTVIPSGCTITAFTTTWMPTRSCFSPMIPTR